LDISGSKDAYLKGGGNNGNGIHSVAPFRSKKKNSEQNKDLDMILY
jgi:hypothetical protein